MSLASRDEIPLDRIAVRPIGARAGQLTLLPPGELAYAFLGSAAPPELLSTTLVNNHWLFEACRVYVRTARGIYWTRFRRLAELKRELEKSKSGVFFSIGRARLVNALRISWLDPSGKTPLLVFVAADGRKEMLTVTRRAWSTLRVRLRLPRRSGVAQAAGGAVTAARDAQIPFRSREDRVVGSRRVG